LALSSYHPNKRLQIIPEVLRVLRDRGETGVGFITTLPESAGAAAIFKQAERYGVRELIFNVGPVVPEGCVELYRRSQAVLLASRLESFSNTIAEAWVHGVPLLASDLNWARGICGEGAGYFRFDDAEDLAQRIVALRDVLERGRQLVEAGRKILATYPDSAARHRQIVEFLEGIVALSAPAGAL
jgi:glycosyltransferase involved in cell wall biosynthesis